MLPFAFLALSIIVNSITSLPSRGLIHTAMTPHSQ